MVSRRDHGGKFWRSQMCRERYIFKKSNSLPFFTEFHAVPRMNEYLLHEFNDNESTAGDTKNTFKI